MRLYDRLYPIAESISMTKTTLNKDTYLLGEQVGYGININFSKLVPIRNFTNPVIVDLLPQGVTFSSI